MVGLGTSKVVVVVVLAVVVGIEVVMCGIVLGKEESSSRLPVVKSRVALDLQLNEANLLSHI